MRWSFGSYGHNYHKSAYLTALILGEFVAALGVRHGKNDIIVSKQIWSGYVFRGSLA